MIWNEFSAITTSLLIKSPYTVVNLLQIQSIFLYLDANDRTELLIKNEKPISTISIEKRRTLPNDLNQPIIQINFYR